MADQKTDGTASTEVRASSRSVRTTAEHEARIKRLASVIQLPDEHEYGVTAKMDKDGNITVTVYGHAFLGDGDEAETVGTAHEVEAPDSLVNALEKVLRDELLNMRAQARVDLARHIVAAQGG